MALKDVFRTALTGRCDARPELARGAHPARRCTCPSVPCRGGADLLRRLFEPLGWQVEASAGQLDPAVPEWGESRYLDVRLTGDVRLADALNHLYVLLPVLDDAKHYWVSNDEVDKLIRAGGGWLSAHPEKELITRRYLSHRRELAALGAGPAGRGRRHRGRAARQRGRGRPRPGRPGPASPAGRAAARRGPRRAARGRRTDGG